MIPSLFCSTQVSTSSSCSRSNSSATKRQRQTQACDRCRIKKRKCDDNEECANCVKAGVPCTRLMSQQKRGPKRRKHSEANKSSTDSLSYPVSPFFVDDPFLSTSSLPSLDNALHSDINNDSSSHGCGPQCFSRVPLLKLKKDFPDSVNQQQHELPSLVLEEPTYTMNPLFRYSSGSSQFIPIHPSNDYLSNELLDTCSLSKWLIDDPHQPKSTCVIGSDIPLANELSKDKGLSWNTEQDPPESTCYSNAIDHFFHNYDSFL